MNLIKRKYLDDINVNDRPDTLLEDDPRQEIWKKQRDEYGFDSREIWNLDYAFTLWLYERVKAYKERTIADMTWNLIEFENKTYTQGEAIDMLLSFLESYFKKDDNLLLVRLGHLWAELSPCMWT